MTVFQGSELACVRGGRQIFHALDFRLADGEALLLTGPNGSGKSSLLRLLAGLLQPSAGSLTWDDRPLRDEEAEAKVAIHYLGHQDAVKPVLTVEENLHFWALLRGGDAQGVIQALDHFGLRPLAATAGRLLSSGQRRRLALARLLASPARLWLLDEPSVGLDQASVQRLSKAIATHRHEGGLVIAATHSELDIGDCQHLRLEEFQLGSQPELVW